MGFYEISLCKCQVLALLGYKFSIYKQGEGIMRWEKSGIDTSLVKSIAKQYECDLITASILIRRNITGSEIEFFLDNNPNRLRDPFQLPGMREAVKRIFDAKETHEKVLVFGDRDVDGITATILVTELLKQIGIDVSWRLPTGDEPYGLSEKAVKEFSHNNGKLIITVDCGISNYREVQLANTLGITVIITDHHNPHDILPEAFTIINPKLANSPYPFKHLAGCGVAYKLVCALRSAIKDIPDNEHLEERDEWEYQLAALGTIADIMPLWNENRILVREGLKSLIEQPRPGVADLLFKLNLTNKQLDTKMIAWLVAPVINATGRMGCPEKIVDLFMEKSAAKREDLVNEVINLNKERRKQETSILNLIEPQVQPSFDTYDGKFIAIYEKAIKRGFTGIIANRLLKRFNIPIIVVSLGEDVYTGSLRFPRNYSPQSFREQFADLFIDCGGHDFAIGFNMEKEKWQMFLKRLSTYTPQIKPEVKPDMEALIIDAELPLTYVTIDILKIMDQFAPYGEMNSPLLFLSRGLKITDCILMGKSEAKHVKLTLDTGVYKWPGIYWNASDKVKNEFDIGDTVDIVYNLNRNFFKGNEIPQLIIQDLILSNMANKNIST
jgi:single-stranded-DNA-specific exonuclease RecJ